MLAWFGTVDLILDKKHSFRVSTGLATCLFMIDERRNLSNRDLAEQMSGIDPTLLRKLLGPVLNSGVVCEEDGSYSIESPGDIEPLLLGKALTTAEMYTDLVAEASSVSVTLAKDAASSHYPGTSGSMLAYIHPKHKHRVYAFVTKTVKRGP